MRLPLRGEGIDRRAALVLRPLRHSSAPLCVGPVGRVCEPNPADAPAACRITKRIEARSTLDIIEGGGRPIDPELRVRVAEAITAIRTAGGKATVTAVRMWITERYGNAGDNDPLSNAVRIVRAEIDAQEVEPSLAVPESVAAL